MAIDGNVAALSRAPREAVPVVIRSGGAPAATAELRLKGQGSFQTIDRKPSFTIKVCGASVGSSLLFRKIHLNNSIQDPAYLRHFLSAAVFRAVRYPCPAVRHAQVRLNARDLGMYALVEGTTRSFLRQEFGNGTGNLYEGGGDVDGTLDVDGGDRGSDFSDLNRLTSAARQPDHDVRMRQMANELEMARFYTFMALETLTQHWDGYCESHQNYRIYRNPATDKFVFIPHGMDTTFGPNNPPVLRVMKGLVAQAVLETQEGKRKYLEVLSGLASNVFVPEKLEEICRREAAVIRPVLVENGEAERFDWALERLIQNVHSHAANVRTQVNSLLHQDNPGLVDLKTLRPVGALTRILPEPGSTHASTKEPQLPSGVYNFDLTLRAEALEGLWRQQGSWQASILRTGTNKVPVDVRLDEDGLLQNTNRRTAFTIKAFADGANGFIAGVKGLRFQPARSDRTLVDEFVTSILFEKAGVPQPARAWAVVSVNGRRMGKYIIIESLTQEFLRRSYGDAQGVLLEGCFADIDTPCHNLAENCATVISELVRAAEKGDFDTVARVVDLEKFAGFIATELFLGMNLYALQQTSYQIYVYDHGRRIDFMPVCKDQMISRTVKPSAEDRVRGILARFMLREPRARQVLEAKVANLQRTAWAEPSLQKMVSDAGDTLQTGLSAEEYATASTALSLVRQTLVERRRTFRLPPASSKPE